jgi:hypothetical protein
MLSLRESQEQFYRAIFDKNQKVTGIDNSRLNIYRQTIFHSLQNALSTSYPVIGRLVGTEFFRFLAQQYIQQYPSVSGDLNRYGDAFFQLLQALPEVAELPYLADIAQLEWLVQLAENARDSSAFPIEKLMAVAPEHYPCLQFFLNPSVFLLSSQYPIADIWLANQADNDGSVELQTGKFYTLIQRHDYQVTVTTLTAEQWAFLTAIEQGTSFGAICESLADIDIGALLQHFIAQSVLVDFNQGLSA